MFLILKDLSSISIDGVPTSTSSRLTLCGLQTNINMVLSYLPVLYLEDDFKDLGVQ